MQYDNDMQSTDYDVGGDTKSEVHTDRPEREHQAG